MSGGSVEPTESSDGSVVARAPLDFVFLAVSFPVLCHAMLGRMQRVALERMNNGPTCTSNS